MERKNILLLGMLLISSFGCTNKNSTSSEEGNYTSHGPIEYVDKMPTSTSEGNILHAFNWRFKDIQDNLEAIANAGFKSVQTSPVQQPKAGGVAWWSLYQPVSFSIGSSSPLGSKAELKTLCEEAEKYGIDIICDIVFNHMATTGENNSNGLPEVDPEVATYEPEIYNNQSQTFHQVSSGLTGSDAITQIYSGLPDLNTGNDLVQARALSLLKECIDVGVDGFRFDAAKHIETENDPNTKSNFWINTLGEAKKYYKDKTGKDLFAYGEILNDVDGGRSISLYTNHMFVTDNTYANGIYSGIINKSAEKMATAAYGKDTGAENLITWVESHDTYIEAATHLSDTYTAKQWAVIASRKGSRSLFFARPDSNTTVGKIDSYTFENETIAVTNRFHNRFLNANENLQYQDTIVFNERYSSDDYGVILVNTTLESSKTAEIKFSNIPDGKYYDTLTGKVVEVKKGKASINFDKNGIVVLTLTETLARPTITTNKKSCLFADTLSIKITASNAEEAKYILNDGEPILFKDTTTITIGEGMEPDDVVTLTVITKNGEFTKTKKYTYTKMYLYEGYVNILNLNKDYLNDYELYIWMWGDGYNPGLWTKEYEVRDDRVLFSKDKNAEGFLLALFEKGYEVTTLNKWDSNVIKQSSDIKGNVDYFDASSF